MSVVFELNANRLKRDAWEGLIEEVTSDLKAPAYEPATFDADGDGATLHLLSEGSIRGVRLTWNDEQVALRLGTLASRTDWQLAFSLMRRALEEGGGTLRRDDGTKLTTFELDPMSADEAALREFGACVAYVQAQLEEAGDEATAALPVTDGIDLPLQPGIWQAARDDVDSLVELETTLAERVAGYAQAHQASIMKLKDGDTVCPWSGIPTITQEADRVALVGVGDQMSGAQELEWKRFVELMGDRMHPCGEGTWYIDGVDEEADAELIQQLNG